MNSAAPIGVFCERAQLPSGLRNTLVSGETPTPSSLMVSRARSPSLRAGSPGMRMQVEAVRSLWTMPRSAARISASQIWLAKAATSAQGSGPWLRRVLARVSPASFSIT